MRCLVQRVLSASVSVDGNTIGSIERGYLVLLGVKNTDTEAVADKMLKKGHSVQQVLNRLEEIRRLTHVMFGVDDLTYLVKNGRLSFASQFFANLFKIKPLINVDRDGRAVVAEKIMTTRRAMLAISDRIRQITASRDYYVFTLYSGDMEIHQEFVDVLAEYNNLSGLPAYPISPVVTAHSGISAFGVGLLPL